MRVSSNFIVVAIDGSAASGKSTTARALAERHHFLYADTGSHYRAVTLFLLEAGVDTTDSAAVVKALKKATLDTVISGRKALLCLNQWTPPDAALRSARINEHVALCAKLPSVRAFLLAYQRSQVEVARKNKFQGLVMEGRDIGSVILPDADFCFFLEADPKTRRQRRAKEGAQDVIHSRDRLDTERKTAPLVCPKHAVRIDTSRYSLTEVVDLISNRITALPDKGVDEVC